ncbi:hypothetical protein EVAR_21413_1 [Eumeta japonica]|uniref:Uncharacterized protein n=1 Tax=Eumeta variegata TaxID=151549 RepID=A0A4C1VFJ8_EUMVA|nr:hypothetical protein EVAR_21413_1 [Eumeta japonica]
MDGGDHLLSSGSHARLPLENTTRKTLHFADAKSNLVLSRSGRTAHRPRHGGHRRKKNRRTDVARHRHKQCSRARPAVTWEKQATRFTGRFVRPIGLLREYMAAAANPFQGITRADGGARAPAGHLEIHRPRQTHYSERFTF